MVANLKHPKSRLSLLLDYLINWLPLQGEKDFTFSWKMPTQLLTVWALDWYWRFGQFRILCTLRNTHKFWKLMKHPLWPNRTRGVSQSQLWTMTQTANEPFIHPWVILYITVSLNTPTDSVMQNKWCKQFTHCVTNLITFWFTYYLDSLRNVHFNFWPIFNYCLI